MKCRLWNARDPDLKRKISVRIHNIGFKMKIPRRNLELPDLDEIP